MSVKETEGNTQIPTVEDEDLGKDIKVSRYLTLVVGHISDIWLNIRPDICCTMAEESVPSTYVRLFVFLLSCIISPPLYFLYCIFTTFREESVPSTPGPVRAAIREKTTS